MDIVTHAGAVHRVVVVAEHAELVALAYRNLSHERHQVIRTALGVLTDAARRVGADGVEVAQYGDAPLLRRRHRHVAQYLLDVQLRPAVRVGDAQRERLGDGHRRRVAVHGGRRREHDGVHAGRRHRFEQRDGAAHVVVKVAQRLLDALANRLESGEVNDGRDSVLVEYLLERRRVAEVHLVELDHLLAGELLDAAHRLPARIDQIVDHHHVVVGLQQLEHGVAADVAGAARDEHHALLVDTSATHRSACARWWRQCRWWRRRIRVPHGECGSQHGRRCN
mmetsp:Transcript_3160/g.7434  ORF Transcript_3160/g.7434 Transcript_3160/m.7434 type:complete len:280 (-) Transcript_3160:6-845(-)